MSDSAADGSSFGLDVCRILGIDNRWITNMTINIGVDDSLHVTFTRLVMDEEAQEIAQQLEVYKFKPSCGKKTSSSRRRNND